MPERGNSSGFLMSLTIALAGNPNSGKTTLFNRLTGTRQTTGNWPGVTVEKKTGSISGTQGAVRVVDLPGIYSLSPYSLEEVITRNYIVHDQPDVVINVIDATNLERNLYLTLQLKKLGCPLVVALNMMDEIRSHGDQLDDQRLARLLGVPVVPVSALIDGIVAGVGGILSFLPQILLLFVFLTLLEDSGYMARAAFIVDRVFQKFGLSGRSFIPMLMGFGCTVPAVMAARTLENPRDRRLTIMITPFMSCGARMPIYAFFASVFFTANKGLVTFSMYLIGIVVAVLSAFILSRTVLRGEETSFVIELPPIGCRMQSRCFSMSMTGCVILLSVPVPSSLPCRWLSG